MIQQQSTKMRALYIGVGLAVLAILPFALIGAGHSFWITIVIDIMILAIFAMGYNILFGHTGLLSFGHAAFFGLGAYGVVFATRGVGFIPQVDSFLPAMLFGVLLATLFGIIIGYLSVLREELYFAMLTIAFNMMLYHIALRWESVTGGDDGLFVGATELNLVVASFDIQSHAVYYFLTLVLFLLTVGVLYRITNSSYGEVLAFIRENPARAESIGINVRRYRWSSFVISSVFAGLAGALMSIRIFVVSADVLFWLVSAEPVVVALLGGFGTFLGPVVGAILFILIENTATGFTLHWEMFLGIVLLFIVLFMPNGVLGTLQDREQSIPVAIRRVTSKIRRNDNGPKREEER